MKYIVIHYETEEGERPLDDFLGRQEAKARVAFDRRVDLLEAGDLPIKRPYIDTLHGGIKELRFKVNKNQYRIFLFFFFKDKIMFTHGIIKKTDKVPDVEINRALKYKNDFEVRYKEGRYII